MYTHIFTGFVSYSGGDYSGLEGEVDTDLNELSAVPSKSGMSKHNRYTNAQCNGHFVNKSFKDVSIFFSCI